MSGSSSNTPAPSTDIPSHRAERYDRQLRLWGNHGQHLLERSHICLINATATGTETLKNLVLPGIGSFTVVGGGVVTESDLGVNFFVSHEHVGKSKSEVTMELLQELNTQVKGNFIDQDFEMILSADADFFAQFTVVVACNLHKPSLVRLSSILWESSVPLVLASSYGLMGYVRIALPSHEVLESHPDSNLEDLRLDCPFPELKLYMDCIDLDALFDSQRGNIPYLIILYKCLCKWKSSHNDQFPCSHRDKQDFKHSIQQEFSNDGKMVDEDNVEEAIKNVNGRLVLSSVPQQVKQVFKDPRCSNITPSSTDFWIMARAVRDFVQNEGQGNLPLRGSLPDMISSSDMYVKLQRVYLTRANNDADSVWSYVQELLSSVSRVKSKITKSDVKDFCRNSAFVGIVKYRSISEELSSLRVDDLRSFLEDPNNDCAYYVLLRAAEMYYALYRCYPGEKQEAFDSDVAQMKTFALDFLCSNGLSSCEISDDHVTEFCRYGGGEIHSVSAFLGGVVSQEVIKLITHQFVPLNNTLIYHGGSCRVVTFAV